MSVPTCVTPRSFIQGWPPFPRRAAPWFRARVGERAGLRYAPEIRFELDRTFDEADRIGALLRRPDVARDIKDE